MPIMIFMTRYYNNSRCSRSIAFVFRCYIRIRFFSLLLLVLLAVLASSCKKEVLKIGGDLLPSSDFVTVKSIDTLSVFSYTMFNDSARTDLPTLSYLGQTFNPFFGSSSAGFVSQIRLSYKWNPEPFTIDSVKLYLHIISVEGGVTDAVHSLEIAEIGNQIYPDTAYYSSTDPDTAGLFRVTDIVLPKLRTDTVNDIELKLPGNGVAFGEYLTRDTSKLFYNNKIADFRSYFKGLFIQMTPSNDPYLISLSLAYNQTNYYNYFTMYVHDTAHITKTYSFILDAKNINASYNVFSHDFTTATQGDKMIHMNTTYKDTLSYLQSLNGVYTKISLPGLQNIKNDPLYSKISINRARLVVPVYFKSSSENPYISKALPPSLRLRYKSSTGARFDVPDYTLASSSDVYHTFFDGKLDTVAQVYNFNIPAFVQAYLKDATNSVKPEVEIFQSAGTRNVILKANKNKTPVKFEFAYTNF